MFMLKFMGWDFFLAINSFQSGYDKIIKNYNITKAVTRNIMRLAKFLNLILGGEKTQET